jgi:hypothetical protein
MRKRLVVAAFLAGLLLEPAVVLAQASITGVVRDASGAVLPGVTVEASSPALIEKTRTVVSDGSGQYRVEDLRPGDYALTFTLTGFTTIKREGIALAGSFTATVNAELKVGTMQETVTVTGASPIVDVQSSKRQQTLDGDVLRALPTGRSAVDLISLVPGITTATRDVGGLSGAGMAQFSNHGGPSTEGRLQVDGISVGASLGGSGVSGYVAEVGTADEVTFTTSGSLGETEVGGPVMNVVPRTGGNASHGSLFGGGAGSGMQGSNFDQALRDAGVRSPNALINTWDVNGSFGGPIAKDRLWYFATARGQGNRKYVANMWQNLNAGDPNAWTYVPDFSRPAQTDSKWKNVSLRLTWQLSTRNKLNLFWDEQAYCGNCTQGGTATTAPEASPNGIGFPSRAQQITWTSPLTNRVLLQAGFGTIFIHWGNNGDEHNFALVPITEQCTNGCPANGNIPGLNYRSANWSDGWIGTLSWHGAASYVTGAHSLKVGYDAAFYVNDQNNLTNVQNVTYRVNNGVPNQITELGLGTPLAGQVLHSRTAFNALFAQDQWTFHRMTVQGALRYDHAWSYYPAQQVGPTTFIPDPLVFGRTNGARYDDISPRAAVTFDLFGTGRTAIKVNAGKYLDPASNNANYTGPDPTARLVTAATRTWTDANGNYVPDCDLTNQLAQDRRPAGGDFCGEISNLNFGKNVFNNSYNPAILSGWGVRPSNWGVGASIQQQVLPRTSVEVGYFVRWFRNFTVTDNLAVTTADYSQYTVTAPSDPRLPGGGGYAVGGLYDVNPTLFGRVNNYVTYAGDYGNQYHHWDGVDVTMSARPSNGLTFQGGIDVGQTVSDDCAVRAQLPELAVVTSSATPPGAVAVTPSNPYCHVASGFLTQVRGVGSYVVPKIDVQVSGTFQSNPGQSLAANYSVSSAVAAQTLGRPLAGSVPNVTVNLVQPGSLYGDRINQVDFRVAKILKFGRTRTQVAFDLYNAFNVNPVLTYNQTFISGGSWLTPQTVLTARLAKVSAQIDF